MYSIEYLFHEVYTFFKDLSYVTNGFKYNKINNIPEWTRDKIIFK